MTVFKPALHLRGDVAVLYPHHETPRRRPVLDLVAVVPIAQFVVLAVARPEVADLRLGVTGTFDAESAWMR